jgi:hypothetical protein
MSERGNYLDLPEEGIIALFFIWWVFCGWISGIIE